MKSTPQKLHVYEALHSLNQGFEQVLADLRRLREFTCFRRELLQALSVVVEETRAWANFELVGVLQNRELGDWTRFGRLRRQWEKQYQHPADVVSAAAGPQRKPAKPAGKRRQGRQGGRP